MSAVAGRKAVFYWKAAGDTEWSTPAGVKEKSLTFNNAPVDITSDDDNGNKTSLADVSASKDWSMEISLVLKDNDLMTAATAEASIDVYLRVPGVWHLTGTARITSAKVKAGQEDPVTGDFSFEGSGAATTGNGAAPT